MLNKIFYKFIPSKKSTKEQVVQNKSIEIQEELNNNNYGFNQPKSHKCRDALFGSLMGLAVIGIPVIEIIEPTPNSSKYSNVEVEYPELQDEIICNPSQLAKGNGDDDSMVELNEIMNLIDFSGMAQLPQSSQKAILTVASAYVRPVLANDPDAKEKIIKQTQDIQQMVDKLIYDEVINPSKSPEEKLAEFKRNNITADEILEFVDFSKLLKYQKDISVLKANLKTSIGYIPRKDYNSNEKAEKAAANAQQYVDELVTKYKRYGKIAGNSDYDHTLTKEELIGLLDQRSADGIDKKTKTEIIANATAGYKTLMFKNIKDNEIKDMNERVCEEIQKAQNKFDNQANNYRLKQFKAKYSID